MEPNPTPTPSPNQRRNEMAVADGVVYVGEDYNEVALNASTGALLWSSAGGDASPVVANGVVYACCGETKGGEYFILYALNAKTGALLWSYDRLLYFLTSSFAVANGVLYVTPGNRVLAFGLKKGQERDGGASKRPSR